LPDSLSAGISQTEAGGSLLPNKVAVDGNRSKATDNSIASGAEADRIRAAYARRDQTVNKQSYRYSVFNTSAYLKGEQVAFEVLQALKRFHFENLGERKVLEVCCGNGH
jgi:hypothetical protein